MNCVIQLLQTGCLYVSVPSGGCYGTWILNAYCFEDQHNYLQPWIFNLSPTATNHQTPNNRLFMYKMGRYALSARVYPQLLVTAEAHVSSPRAI